MLWGLLDAQPGVIALGLIVRDVLLAAFAAVLALFGAQLARIDAGRRRWWLAAALAPVGVFATAPFWIGTLPSLPVRSTVVVPSLFLIYAFAVLVAVTRLGMTADASEAPVR